MNNPAAVKLTHNLKGDAFMWLWAKYVRAVNDQKHCTACLRGPYSKKLSRHNPDVLGKGEVVENGVDLNRFRPQPETPGQRLLFIGSFRHFPNVAAFRFSTEEAWPGLRERLPQTQGHGRRQIAKRFPLRSPWGWRRW